MNIRTDFADEININRSDEYVKKTKKFKQCKVTNIEILKDKNMFNKERGTYVSIDFIDLLESVIIKLLLFIKLFYKQRTLRRDAHSRERKMSQATALGARISQARCYFRF